MTDQSNSDKVAAIKNLLGEWSSEISTIKTPEEVYQEKFQKLKAHYDRELDLLWKKGLSKDGHDSFREKVSRQNEDMKDFERNHDAFLLTEEQNYEHQNGDHILSLVNRIFSIAGPPLQVEVVREPGGLRKRAVFCSIPIGDIPSPQELSDEEATETDTDSLSSPPESPRPPGNPAPATDGKTDSLTTPSNGGRDRINSSESHLKRKAAEVPNSPAAQKRSRVESGFSLTEKTISFDTVYQGGNAQTKYKIVRYPKEFGKFYILKCDEHNKHFHRDPIIGAAKHLGGAPHNLSRGHGNAIQKLGIAVLGCNEILMAKNNDAVEAALQAERGQANGTSAEGIHGDQEDRHDDDRSQVAQKAHLGRLGARKSRSGISEGIINPVPGDVHSVYHRGTLGWYPAIILPFRDGNFTSIGLAGDLREVGLLRNPPPCYSQDVSTGKLSWRKGFEDGGPSVTERKVPVLLLDDSIFPDRCSSIWASVQDLKAYEANDYDETYQERASRWLRSRWLRERS